MTSLVVSHGVYAVFVLMAVDAVFPTAAFTQEVSVAGHT